MADCREDAPRGPCCSAAISGPLISDVLANVVSQGLELWRY
jgi:hypothetical protein